MWVVSKLAGLTLIGVCILHCSAVDWVRECVAGYMTCEPACTVDLCQWPSVLRSVCYVGKRLAYRELPNNSFLFLHCTVSIIAMFPLQCRIHVCLVCVMHTLRSGHWLLCIVCVFFMSCCCWSVWLSYTWIVASVTFKSVYPAGICAGLTILSASCWCIVFVTRRAIFQLVGLKRLAIFRISGLW